MLLIFLRSISARFHKFTESKNYQFCLKRIIQNFKILPQLILLFYRAN